MKLQRTRCCTHFNLQDIQILPEIVSLKIEKLLYVTVSEIP